MLVFLGAHQIHRLPYSHDRNFAAGYTNGYLQELMGYNKDKKIVLDESRSIGLRYISLMHCVSQFTWLTDCGFRNELRHLYHNCGLRRDILNTTDILTSSMLELDRQRNAFLHRLWNFATIRRAEKAKGNRNPTKKELNNLFDMSDILDERAIKNRKIR